MASVQSSIRAEVSRGRCPVPTEADTFAAYAIASAKGLIPEMEYAARLTLKHPMIFESIGKRLRLFEGCALRDLTDFRKRCRDNLVTCIDSFLDVQCSGPSSFWVGCPEVSVPGEQHSRLSGVLPRWLTQLFLSIREELKFQKISYPLDIHLRIRREYLRAFQNHAACSFCSVVNRKNGLSFCVGLESKLVQALKKVPHSPYFPSTTN